MDKHNIEKNLKKAILEGRFIDAKLFIVNFSQNEFSDIICKIADESIIVYTFVCYLLIEKELSKYHIIAAEILCIPLFSIPGAYNSALYHTRRALELDPNNISYMESLLFFYRIPDQLIAKEEAIKIAQTILKVNPNSKAALHVISDLMDFNTKIES